MAMPVDEERKKYARDFISLVKQRFHGRTAHKYVQFKTLLTAPNWTTYDADVKSVFAGNDDLLQQFRHFLPNSSSTSPSSSSSNLSAADKSMKEAVTLLNRVMRDLKGDEYLFRKFVKIVTRFNEHQSAHLLKKQLFVFFQKHPALKIDFSGCLAIGMEKNPGSERSKLQKEMICQGEDDLVVRDIRFNRMRFAIESAQRLINENQYLDMEEQIDFLGYFTAVDIKCLKDEMRAVARIFSNRLQTRQTAVQCSYAIVSCLNEKIKGSESGWSEEKKAAFQFCVDQESEIPTWDWH